MILITYYNNDRIGYRILGVATSEEEAAGILGKQAKFSRTEFIKKLRVHGIYILTSGYMIINTTKEVDTSHNKYYQLGLPYLTDLTEIDNFKSFAKSYIRNFKIKKII